MFWTVSARHSSGVSRSGTDDTPEDLTTNAHFWNGAQETIEGITMVENSSSIGDYGEPVPGGGGFTASTEVTLVLGGGELWHQTAVGLLRCQRHLSML